VDENKTEAGRYKILVNGTTECYRHSLRIALAAAEYLRIKSVNTLVEVRDTLTGAIVDAGTASGGEDR